MNNLRSISEAARTTGLEEYYFSQKLAEVRALHTDEMPVINLGVGNPDLPPPPEAVEALIASAREPAHHGYQPYRGVADLRRGIAAFMQRMYGILPDAEHMVLPLIGSKEGIVHLSLAFVNEGDEVLVPDPGYPTYAAAARLAGGKVRTYAVHAEGDAVNLSELRRIDFSRVKLMWINFPHMPTGRTLPLEKLHALVELARERKFLLVNDLAYGLIRNPHPFSLMSVPGAEEVCLELHSMSKSHNMAGWRMGWVIGKQEFIQSILRVKSNMDSGMFLPIQHAVTAALEVSESWYDQLNRNYRQRSAVAAHLLRLLNCTWSEHQAGLFLWGKLPVGTDDYAVVDDLLYRARVFLTPGSVFGSRGAGHIRVSLCASVERMEEAVQRIELMIVRQAGGRSHFFPVREDKENNMH
jgi:LL-diaminopimelate aminotransferase